MAKGTIEELRYYQSLPLKMKLSLTKQRIREWVEYYGEDGVYVSFSGGKDSTCLLDIVWNECGYTNVPAVFVDTGLEYPEIREFVKGYGDKVTWLKPKLTFKEVVTKYGYPIISKEVSEAVYGAKRYIEAYRQTDRQTDRQTSPTHQAIKRSLDLESLKNPTRGGADSRYRKLRGLGEFHSAKRETESRHESTDSRVATANASDGEFP